MAVSDSHDGCPRGWRDRRSPISSGGAGAGVPSPGPRERHSVRRHRTGHRSEGAHAGRLRVGDHQGTAGHGTGYSESGGRVAVSAGGCLAVSQAPSNPTCIPGVRHRRVHQPGGGDGRLCAGDTPRHSRAQRVPGDGQQGPGAVGGRDIFGFRQRLGLFQAVQGEGFGHSGQAGVLGAGSGAHSCRSC